MGLIEETGTFITLVRLFTSTALGTANMAGKGHHVAKTDTWHP